MCIDNSPCLHHLLEDHDVLGRVSRTEQAKALGLSRGQLLDALSGHAGKSASSTLASTLGIEVAAVIAAVGTERCTRRRPKRGRSEYGNEVMRLMTTAGLSVDELLARMKVDRTSFYHGLGEGTRPTEAHILSVATALDADVVGLAQLAGHVVEHELDRERLRLGMSRDRFARSRGVDAPLLFGERAAVSPALARRVALASGATPEEATLIAANTRKLSPVRNATALGDLILSHLDREGISLSKFALLLNIPRQAVSSWVDGLGSPSSQNAAVLAELMRVDLDAVMEARHIDKQATSERSAGPGRTLAELRRSHRMNRSSAASLLGLSQLTLRRAESGRLSTEEINRIVDNARVIYAGTR